MKAALLTVRGPEGEAVYPVDGGVTIGSDPACAVRSRSAAPKHCRIAGDGESYVATDLTGTATVAVNGKRGRQHALKDGDFLHVGTLEIRFSLEELYVAPAEPAPQAVRVAPRRVVKDPGRAPRGKGAWIAAGVAALLLVALVALWPAAPAPKLEVSRAKPALSIPPAPLPPTAEVVPEAAAPPSKTRVPAETATPERSLPPAPAVAPEPIRAPETEAPPALSAETRVRTAEKLLEQGSRLEALKHLVEAASLDPALSALPSSYGFRKSEDGRLWGDVDALRHHKLARLFSSGKVEGWEDVGTPGSFGGRYVALLLELQRTLSKGDGFRRTAERLRTFSCEGGPSGSREHLRALSGSFQAAVVCGACREGRRICGRCEGKRRIDLPCPKCGGSGRDRVTQGVAGGARFTVKCRNCDGRKVFRNAGCPDCSVSGSVTCEECKGDPWSAFACPAAGCRAGRVACGSCEGRGRVQPVCPVCDGRRRVQASGAIDGADVSVKCRNCEGTGRVGWTDCGGCESGHVACEGCKGGAQRPRRIQAGVSAVFSTTPCRACEGNGWPVPGIAIACGECHGLGLRLQAK